MSTLSKEKIQAYFDRISLPENVRSLLFEGPDSAQALKSVTTLQQYHMAAVPYENLELHYSNHHTMILDEDYVYELVVNRGRGGMCPQIHQLFSKLLRSLGFKAYCAGGRLNAIASHAASPGLDKTKVNYGPWMHLITLVTIHGTTHIVDTNFGQFGSPSPVPLVHNQPVVDIWSRQRRMLYDRLPGLIDQEQRWWRMQLRDNDTEPWVDVYCFVEVEWLPMDFSLLIAGLASTGSSWFTYRVICLRLILENEVPTGYLIIWENELRRLSEGKTEVLQKFYNESDRVAALADELNTVLTPEEQQCIIGTGTELKVDDDDIYG